MDKRRHNEPNEDTREAKRGAYTESILNPQKSDTGMSIISCQQGGLIASSLLLLLQPSTAFLLSSSSSSSSLTFLKKTTALTTSILTTSTVLENSSSSLVAEEGDHSSSSSSTTSIDMTTQQQQNEQSTSSIRESLQSPRVRSVLYMGCAMALHFGGYEFFRNSILALFTSSEYGGFTHPAAYPLANGLISPFSILLLWGYSRQLNNNNNQQGKIRERGGPRIALYNTTLFSIVFIATSCFILQLSRIFPGIVPKILHQFIIGITFLFQSSYQYLLYTQQWSFVGSVLTPNEGAQYFATLAGCSSLISSLCGACIPYLLPYTGLLGLMATTCITLTVCLWCSDRAYILAQENGFDPGDAAAAATSNPKMEKKNDDKDKSNNNKTGTTTNNTISDTIRLFRRVPTLMALMMEVLTFQSLNTILNVAFVRATRIEIPNDLLRSAYTSRFFSYINGMSAMLQFLILPFCMKYTEPAWIWRVMPLIPLAVCLYQTIAFATAGTLSLTLLAAAFFLSKTMDYSLRSVVFAMAFQPLDFESRFVGKEVIGVLGSRFGKSGMSIILSGLTALGLTSNIRSLIHLAMGAVAMWFSSTMWLSFLIPSKAEAQAIVKERQKVQEEQRHQQQQQDELDKKKTN